MDAATSAGRLRQSAPGAPSSQVPWPANETPLHLRGGERHPRLYRPPRVFGVAGGDGSDGGVRVLVGGGHRRQDLGDPRGGLAVQYLGRSQPHARAGKGAGLVGAQYVHQGENRASPEPGIPVARGEELRISAALAP